MMLCLIFLLGGCSSLPITYKMINSIRAVSMFGAMIGYNKCKYRNKISVFSLHWMMNEYSLTFLFFTIVFKVI